MIRGGRVEAAAAAAAVGRTAVRQQEPLATGDGNARTGGSWNVVQGRRRDAPGRWSAEEEEVDRDGRSTGEGGVRRVKGLLGLSPLGLISCLLRGQVNLACKSRNPLYIRRGDVSI
jgi:hypothetical protein